MKLEFRTEILHLHESQISKSYEKVFSDREKSATKIESNKETPKIRKQVNRKCYFDKQEEIESDSRKRSRHSQTVEAAT